MLDPNNLIVEIRTKFGDVPFPEHCGLLAARLQDDWISGEKVLAQTALVDRLHIKYCQDESIDAYIADGNYRKRDPRFKARDRYQPKARKAQFFKAADFDYSASNDACICPAGKTMWRQRTRQIDGNA